MLDMLSGDSDNSDESDIDESDHDMTYIPLSSTSIDKSSGIFFVCS